MTGAALEKGHFEEPWLIAETIGPVKHRKAGSGVILRKGHLDQTWGDVEYVDMTFSISKSYLSLCMGVAVNDGIIPDVHAPIRTIVKDGGFDSEQNKNITWAQMLQLTSEWEEPCGTNQIGLITIDVIGDSQNLDKRGSKRSLQPPWDLLGIQRCPC